MTGAIKPPLRAVAPAPLLMQARANCAARLRAQGHEVEAQNFERGDRDEAWAMRHEVNKLQAEADACPQQQHARPIWNRPGGPSDAVPADGE